MTPKEAYAKMCSDLGLGEDSSSKGYVPQTGERTLKGYVEKNASSEIVLNTQSAGFNNKGMLEENLKDFELGSMEEFLHMYINHRGMLHQKEIYGSVGSKTSNGGVVSPHAKDVKQLYEYLNNGKYH